MNAVEIRMLFKIFSFSQYDLAFLASSCQGETPNNPPHFHPCCTPMCWQPTFVLCNSDPSLVYSSPSYFLQGLWGFSCPRKCNKKECWKHWKRGLEERDERRWVGVGKKRQNKHSCRVRTDYIFIFFKKVSGCVLKSSCCCSFQK